MRLGERRFICVADVTNSVVVTEVRHVGRQALAAPNVLEVLLLFELFHGLHDVPEHFHDAMVFVTTEVLGDLLDSIKVHNLVSSSSDFNFFPSEHVQDVSRDDNVDAFLDPIELLLAFSETSLAQKISKFFNVVFGDHLVKSTFTNLNFLLVAQNSSECLFNSSFKVCITQLLGVLAQLLDSLPSISIEALEVIEHKLFVVKLLPEDRVEVEGYVGSRAESRTHQKSQEVVHALVSGVLGHRINVETLTAVTMVESVVRSFD